MTRREPPEKPKKKSSYFRWVAPSLEILVTEEFADKYLAASFRPLKALATKLAFGVESVALGLWLAAGAIGQILYLSLALFGGGVLMVSYTKGHNMFFFAEEERPESEGDGVACEEIVVDFLLQCTPPDLPVRP